MDPQANELAQMEVARQILRIVDETVDYNTAAEKELYHAAERLAELVMAGHNWRTLQGQKAPGYAPADDPDANLIVLVP